MRLTACIALFCFLVLLAPGAQAQDKPLLVLQLESALDLSVTGRKAGLSGAVYALAPNGENSGAHSVQVAFDARNRPVLTRLVRKVGSSADAEALLSAATTILPVVLPRWSDGDTVLTEKAAPALQAYSAGGEATRTAIAADAGRTVVLDFVAAEGLAVIDLPVGASEARRLDEAAVRQLVSDSTLTFEGGPTNGHRRYHAPNGRLGGGREDGTTLETGSWKTNRDGHYCIETAPVPEYRCLVVYETEARHVAVPIVNGAADSRGLRHFSVEFGNPGGFTAPRRNDATVAAVTAMIVDGQTEERRYPDGGADKLYLRPGGDFIGLRKSSPVQGRWSVMSDGRRCLTEMDGSSECAFLSETDGGTFRLFDAHGTYLGEALYRDGNPNGF